MKTFALVLVLSGLASCTVHFHFHNLPASTTTTQVQATPASSCSPAPTSARAPHDALVQTRKSDTWPPDLGTVEGVVVDPGGKPVRARVAVIAAEGGSISNSTDERGRFEIQRPSDKFALHASTEDGLIALSSGDHARGAVELHLQPGGMLVIDLEGRESTRCAVFAQHLRAEDFTLRAGKTAKVVVPAGGVRVRLYEGDAVFAEREFTISVGESREATFKLGS